jgi:5-methylcytosine-specific restriction endonuclease McrA
MSDDSRLFQQLLFGNEDEARAQELTRIAAIEEARAYAEARKLAWYEGRPFPEDRAKWCVTHREIINAQSREAYRLRYAEAAEYYLRSSARSRAERLGCNIGRRGPILDVYRRAVHEPVILCYWCKTLTTPGERHVDHIQPLAAGGAHVAGNLCVTCEGCNLAKGDRSPSEFRMSVAEKRIANGLIASAYFRRRHAHSAVLVARPATADGTAEEPPLAT